MEKLFLGEISKRLYEQIMQVAAHDLNVLIVGETGAGKEVISDLIQENSRRRTAPYVKLNCAAIPETLIESELFGHERGAFTGADKKKEGKLEAAHTGTILLDEIGDMPIMLQPRLLRVTDGHPFSRIGSNEEIKVDVRFISSTHIDIQKAIGENRFRSDLYYRLAGAVIAVPPLRDRKDEILAIANRILEDKQAEIESPARFFAASAIQAMLYYEWPGNFRELENRITSGMLKAQDKEITSENMFNSHKEEGKSGRVEDLEDLDLMKLEREALMEALKRTNFVQKEAAALLKISPRSLNHKIRLLGIKHPTWKVNN